MVDLFEALAKRPIPAAQLFKIVLRDRDFTASEVELLQFSPPRQRQHQPLEPDRLLRAAITIQDAHNEMHCGKARNTQAAQKIDGAMKRKAIAPGVNASAMKMRDIGFRERDFFRHLLRMGSVSETGRERNMFGDAGSDWRTSKSSSVVRRYEDHLVLPG